MIREEIIENLWGEAVRRDFNIGKSDITEIVDYVIKHNEPQLPAGLDEAAEKEIERFCSDMLNVDIIWARMPLTKRFGLQMAKFGAEWMAGQFQKIEGDLVDWYSTSDGKDYCCGVKTIDAFEVPEGFYIRKRQ